MNKTKQKKRKVGRPTVLPELTPRIRELVLLGYTYRKIRAELTINEKTWDEWVRVDYQGFRVLLRTYDHEYKLKCAERNIVDALQMKTEEQVVGMFGPLVDKKTKKPVMRTNDKLVKIKLDTSVFVAETLGKKEYSKKIQLEDTTPKKLVILKDGNRKDNI